MCHLHAVWFSGSARGEEDEAGIIPINLSLWQKGANVVSTIVKRFPHQLIDGDADMTLRHRHHVLQARNGQNYLGRGRVNNMTQLRFRADANVLRHISRANLESGQNAHQHGDGALQK